ncbi:MAG TPA: hypothetical protein VFM49_17835, partial [Chloroflexia bacterium]|nr:hypothetical protein [Chloroflexia bacterium]
MRRFALRWGLVGMGALLLVALGWTLGPTRAAPPGQAGTGPAGAPAAQTGRLTLSNPPGAPASQPGGGPPVPAAPNVVLYDQYDNASASQNTSSQQFEPTLAQYNDQGADDFVVPGGVAWTVNEVDVVGDRSTTTSPASFNVFFYANSGTLPGTPVYTATAQTYTRTGTDYVISLATPAVLATGTYWVSVQARLNAGTGGTANQWYWRNRTVQSNNPAAWRNPGNGFATNCTNWGVRSTCLGQSTPDQVFRLAGTVAGVTPSPTVTQT